MSWSGCATRVIRSDQVLLPLDAGKAYTPEVDGWFMSDATYQRVRTAVADKVTELQQLQRQPATNGGAK